MKLVDPHYVCFTFPAAGVPAGFAADVATTDARVMAVGVPLLGGVPSSALFSVASSAWAHYFGGRMTALYPGVAASSFNEVALMMY
jgi:hypothetical protein